MNIRMVCVAGAMVASGGCAADRLTIPARPEPVTLVATQTIGTVGGAERCCTWHASRPANPGPFPLYVVDGRVLGAGRANLTDERILRVQGDGRTEILALRIDDIVTLDVHKGEEVVGIYGPQAVGGALIITTRHAARRR